MYGWRFGFDSPAVAKIQHDQPPQRLIATYTSKQFNASILI